MCMSCSTMPSAYSSCPEMPRQLGADVGAEVHPGAAPPDEPGLAGRCCSRMKAMAASEVSSSTVSIRFLVSGPVSSICVPSVGRSGSRRAGRSARGRSAVGQFQVARVVLVLGLLLGVEVVEIAEELVEAVVGGQVLVAVAEVVLAELAGGVALALSSTAMVGSSSRMPSSAPGRPTLERPVRNTLWPMMNEDRPGGAGLLAVVVGDVVAPDHALSRRRVSSRGRQRRRRCGRCWASR
jgi:hypothetical protein